MGKLDFEKAKSDIAAIVEIVKCVPEGLQQRCFELLFEAAFNDETLGKKKSFEKEEPKRQDEKERREPPPSGRKLPSNVLAFIRKNDISDDQLGKLFMLDHEPLLPVYKIPKAAMAKSQVIKVMMILLENGLLNNSFSAPYTELRESVKEDGFYDSNFTQTMKNNHALFRGAVTKSGISEEGVVELTGAGFERLAEIVKELGQ